MSPRAATPHLVVQARGPGPGPWSFVARVPGARRADEEVRTLGLYGGRGPEPGALARFVEESPAGAARYYVFTRRGAWRRLPAVPAELGGGTNWQTAWEGPNASPRALVRWAAHAGVARQNLALAAAGAVRAAAEVAAVGMRPEERLAVGRVEAWAHGEDVPAAEFQRLGDAASTAALGAEGEGPTHVASAVMDLTYIPRRDRDLSPAVDAAFLAELLASKGGGPRAVRAASDRVREHLPLGHVLLAYVEGVTP